MRPRRSSGTSSASHPVGSSATVTAATSWSFAAPSWIRRMRSSAQWRATVVSHAPGRRGTPSLGHRSAARAKASCAHSSATSQSPVRRIRVAITLPHSWWNASVRAASTSAVTSPRSGAPRCCRCAHRDLPRHLERIVEVLAIDEEIARQLLLGLGKRAVGGEDLAAAQPHGRGVRARAQTLPALQDAPLGHRFHPLAVLREHASSSASVRVLWAASSPAINSRYRICPPGFVCGLVLTTIGKPPDRHFPPRLFRPPLVSQAMAVPGAPEPAPVGLADPDLLELRTGDVAAGGGCVARAPDGRVVFVRHSLPGERVRVRVTATARSYTRADAVEVLEPSPDRVSPPCPHAGPGRCGGCDFHMWPRTAQLKAFRIAEKLERLAGLQRHVRVERVEGIVTGWAGAAASGWRWTRRDVGFHS